ncbi:MAG: hypothetical protein F3739_08685 [Nitrospinae bacterium]|nr:hypothetical protein [Nitrospinota bacterium]
MVDDNAKIFIGNRDGNGRKAIGNGLRSVEKGETLWEIRNDNYTIPLWLISSYNSDKDINSLSVGEPIVIPVIAPKDKNA